MLGKQSEIKHVRKPRIRKHPGVLTSTRADKDDYNSDNVDIPGRVASFQQGMNSNG
jgi:hypothetical protein